MEYTREPPWGQRREACGAPVPPAPRLPARAQRELAHEPVTACIITFNDEHHIEECIRSLGFCDEVLVVDAHSTDATREIARRLGARVLEHDWPGYEAQKAFAVGHALHDWVLCLNADERISPRLQNQIHVWQAIRFGRFAAFGMPRRTQYLGRFLRHGHGCSRDLIRLFDRTRGVKQPARSLSGALEQHVVQDPIDHAEHDQHCAALSAQWMLDRGQRCSLAGVVARPLWRFLHGYVLRAGFLDGWRGLLFACMEAAYVRHQYFCLFVLQRGREGRQVVV